jgi:hypothetical protein
LFGLLMNDTSFHSFFSLFLLSPLSFSFKNFLHFIFDLFSHFLLTLTVLQFVRAKCLSTAFQEVFRQLLLRKRFSEETTQVAAIRMRPDNTSLECSRNLPLNVILTSDTTVKLTLLEVRTFLKRASNGQVTLRIRKSFTTSNMEDVFYKRSTLNGRGLYFFLCWSNVCNFCFTRKSVWNLHQPNLPNCGFL